MSKELQDELSKILGESQEADSKKKTVTFYIDTEVLTAFKGILRNKRLMSRTVEALIRDFIRSRETLVVDFHQTSKKKGQEP